MYVKKIVLCITNTHVNNEKLEKFTKITRIAKTNFNVFTLSETQSTVAKRKNLEI